MINVVLVPNIVEANGKTVRENNMEIQHKVPLNRIVEITCDNEDKGKFFRVIKHGRDCDGSPVYYLEPLESFCYGEDSFKDITHEMREFVKEIKQ